MAFKIEANINLQDEVIDLYAQVKEEHNFNNIVDMVVYAVGIGIQHLQVPHYTKEAIIEEVLTRREAEKLTGMSKQLFQTYISDGQVIPFKEYGTGSGKVQLFWKSDLMTTFELEGLKMKHSSLPKK